MTTAQELPRLTDRQSETLSTIIDYIRDNSMPPTLREIGDRMGISSTNGVNDHLRALERKGYIESLPLKSRGIKVLWKADDGKLPSDEPRDLPPEVTTEHMARAATVLMKGDRVVIQRLVAEALAAREA